MNCWVDPTSKLGEAGVTAMEVIVFVEEDVTVICAVPLAPPNDAVTVVDPAATPVARPVALTVAVEGAALVHEALVLTSFVDWSLYVAMAVNCWVAPTATLAVGGVTEIEVTVGAAVATVMVD